MPTEYGLSHNYPNPFNPVTQISYELPKESNVSIVIYDSNGHIVSKLAEDYQSARCYSLQWDAIDTAGNKVSSGVYFARLQVGEYSKTIKMGYLC